MDDKALEKKFHNKKFLKSNDFASAMAKVIVFAKENKGLLIAAVTVFAVIITAIPAFKWYKLQRVTKFNAKLFDAETSLKKEPLLRELITDYKDLPANDYARMALVDNLLDHDQKEEAIALIDEGLKEPRTNIYSTLLVMKKINILKNQNKFSEAAQVASDNQTQIIGTFINKYKIINAELYVLAGNKEAARALYQEVGSFAGVGAESGALIEGFDPVIANHAKDMLLLIDLGII